MRYKHPSRSVFHWNAFVREKEKFYSERFPWASSFWRILTWKCLCKSFFYRPLRTSEGSNWLFSLFLCSPVWITNRFLRVDVLSFISLLATVSQIKDDCESIGSDCKTNKSCVAAQQSFFSIRMHWFIAFSWWFNLREWHITPLSTSFAPRKWCHCLYLTGRQVLMKPLVKLQQSEIKKWVLRQQKKLKHWQRLGKTARVWCQHGGGGEKNRAGKLHKAPSRAAVFVGMINDWTLLCGLVKPL